MLDLTGVLDAPVQKPPEAPAAVETQDRKPRTRSATSGTKGRKFLYFDLETVPDESRLDAFGLEPLPSTREETPGDQLPDPASIIAGKVTDVEKALAKLWPPNAWTEAVFAKEMEQEKPRKGVLDLLLALIYARNNETAKIVAAAAERQKLLSVTPEFNKIISAGWCIGSGPTEAMVVGAPPQWSQAAKISEIDIVDRIWSLIESSGPIVGFNVLHFDLPTLFVRSALLGVKPPRKLDLRPWGDDVIDLMAVRYPKGPGRKLKELAVCYGFAVPAGDFDGSQVYAAWKAGEFNQIAAYVRSDVEISRKLHSLYRGFFCA